MSAGPILTLPYRLPFDWSGLTAFLAARAIEGIEACADGVYRRSISIDRAGGRHRGRLAVNNDADRQRLVVSLEAGLAPVADEVATRCRQLFDLDAEPARVVKALGPLAAPRPGLRLPGAVNGFEIAVRAILGQQVSVKAARTLAGRVVASFGDPLAQTGTTRGGACPDPIRHTFPRPEVLAGLATDDRGVAPDLARLGITGQRTRTLVGLARALAEGDLALTPGSDPQAVMAALQKLAGIGPWTAQYIAMRALSWTDAFPASDLGVLKALGTRDPKVATARAEAWRPWRAYAVIHLWSGGEA